MPLALPRTVVKTDVCDSSRGPRARQIHLDRVLKQVLDETLAAATQYDPESWHCRFDGDSSTWVIPSEVPKAWIAADQTRNLNMALRRNNRHVDSESKLRLRVALDHGEVEVEGQHIGGRPITTAARLCDSEPLRKAMREAPDVYLGLIVSDSFYRDVILEGELDLDPGKFVEVEVAVKTFRSKAWIYLVDGPATRATPPPENEPPPTSTGGASQISHITSSGDHNVNSITNHNFPHRWGT